MRESSSHLGLRWDQRTTREQADKQAQEHKYCIENPSVIPHFINNKGASLLAIQQGKLHYIKLHCFLYTKFTQKVKM